MGPEIVPGVAGLEIIARELAVLVVPQAFVAVTVRVPDAQELPKLTLTDVVPWPLTMVAPVVIFQV